MTIAPSTPKLFQPIKIGEATLQHRVVLAPLSRHRADEAYVHVDLAVEYYTQRASTPGTLLISEAATIAPQAGVGYAHAAAIYSDAQVAAWKKVVDAVHANDSFIWAQIFALGRAADPKILEKDGPFDFVSASAIAMAEGAPVPRALTVEEIKEYVQWFAQAAKNAVHGAGFDGVEIHAANGYLLDQFLQSNSNERTDEYGGSVENRIHFVSEVVQAVIAVVGAERTSIRISPWSPFQGMRMSDPIPTFSALVGHLAEAHPDLAYVHVVEPRISGNIESEGSDKESNDFMRTLWSPRPLIVAGGYDRESAIEAAEKDNVLVAVGRHFTSNPDLPKRWMVNAELTSYDRSTFYTQGAEGYTDWPFLDASVGGPNKP